MPPTLSAVLKSEANRDPSTKGPLLRYFGILTREEVRELPCPYSKRRTITVRSGGTGVPGKETAQQTPSSVGDGIRYRMSHWTL